MSPIVEQKHANMNHHLFGEFLNHPAKSSKSIEDARQLLSEERPFTYMLLACDSGSSLYLCFYDGRKEFHAHFCQLFESRWKNGAHVTYLSLQSLIQAVMGCLGTPFLDQHSNVESLYLDRCLKY